MKEEAEERKEQGKGNRTDIQEERGTAEDKQRQRKDEETRRRGEG